MAKNLYPQLKTHSSFESAAARRRMQSRRTEKNTPNKRDIIAFRKPPKKTSWILKMTQLYLHIISSERK